MRVKIAPSRAVGTVTAPPSKSMAHRALICGALSVGSRVDNLAWSKDIEATLACLRAMGAAVEQTETSVIVGRLDPFHLPPNAILPCNESGSTLRFFLPLCMLCGQPITLTGSRRLLERPLGIYEDICRQQGIQMERRDTSVTVCGRLTAGEYTIPGDVSSQFITGLLFALPLLPADSHLTVTGRFESASYIDMTLSALRAFGICVDRHDATFFIPGGQRYAASVYTVEGDCSNAAFLDGFNLLNGDVKVNGLSDETLQGDRIYRDFYRQLQNGEKHFDLADCPDLAPVLFALAAALDGAVFTGTARLRIKESDRAAAMAAELAKFGVGATVGENKVEILPSDLRVPTEPLDGHNDHRIVMALSLLCSVTGGVIIGAEAVAKSYPDFFDVIKLLEIGLSIDET
ncbi:MAG: 3-phosphoshikimate 1-carboxyvinyltransferase [Clostridia bacterium]|nr:3-phosphoshikimate 1-carboxyvinyltransferase [Clostridia bacterium]